MPKIPLIAATLAALTSTGIDARAQWAPWCAYDVRGGTNCGFDTLEQCRVNLSGIGGTCSPNPSYHRAATDQRRHPR